MRLLTPAPSHPHTVHLGIVVLQQLDQVVFVVVKLNIGLRSMFTNTVMIVSPCSEAEQSVC